MIELHCHTKISDGSLDIKETVELASKKGIKYLAITDHDTTLGIDEAMYYGKKYDVEIIPGIEISGYDFENNKKAHILGYHINYKDNYLNDFCKELRSRRFEAAGKMIDIIKNSGYDLSFNKVEKYAEGSTGIFKQHIMHVLIDKGYTDKIYSILYYHLFSSNPRTRGIAYTPLEYIDVLEAVIAIKKANGIAVLAHPALSDCYDTIPKLIKSGLDGLEVKHPHQKHHEEKRLCSIAYYYDLIITGGSDYHGFYGHLDEELGMCNPGIEIIYKLNYLKKNNSIIESIK
jgi:predicted metal-dependent phosphoesterase TrpH